MLPKYVVGHLFSLCQKIGLVQNDLNSFSEVHSLVEQARQLLLQAVDLLKDTLKSKKPLQYKFDFDKDD